MNSNIKTGIRVLSITILLFVIIVLLINTSLFDEDLNPEIIKFVQGLPMPVVKGNAYFALMGLSAHEDNDIVQTGHNLIKRYIKNKASGNDELTISDYQQSFDINNSVDKTWRMHLKPCDSRIDFNCLNKTSKDLTASILNNPRFQVMLNRYDKIVKMKTFENYLITTFSTPFIDYALMMNLSQIKLADTYKNSTRHLFLKTLLQDIKYWRMQLNNGKYLIDKMVAYASIRKDIHYLSEFMRNNELNISDSTTIKSILKPLTSEELNLSESFIAESRTMFNIKNIVGFSFYNLLYQPNATNNYHYEINVKSQIQFANLPLKELIQKRKLKQKKIEPSAFQFNYLYNYIGKTFVEYAGCACSDYIVRGYDLNNIFKIVNMQFLSKISSDQNIQELLQTKNNLNPYNDKSFQFDRKSKVIKFDCLDNYSKCEIKI